MGPTDRPALPYTVSSPDWKGIDAEASREILSSVLLVWSRVYSVSKVVVMAFMHYGVEVGSPDNLL
jgi:hypothetical protein